MATIVPTAPQGWGSRPDGSPDSDLVEALRAGSREAFEQLYEQYRARIYNLALRILQSPEDACDITHDVFIKVYRRLPGSRVAGPQLKPWLYRVAVNACYDHLRTRKVHRDIDDVSTDTSAATIDTFEQAELSHLVEKTLADLSERHRTVLVLKDIHGLRHDEIAEILGISRGATETLLFRARESFRTHYARLTSELPIAACSVASDAALAAVGGGLDRHERRRVLAHAKHCPVCRKTVSTWGAAAVGLGLLVPEAPLPAALQGALPFAGAGAAGAAGAGAAGAGAAGAGAGAAGVSASGAAAGTLAGAAGAAAGSSAGLSLAAGGVIAKISGVAGAKVAALVIAATCTAGGGVAAYETGVLPGARPSPPPAVASQSGGVEAAKTTPPGLAVAAANGGKGAERSAAAGMANGKGHENDTATSNGEGNGKGHANGKANGKENGTANGNGENNGNANGQGNGNANGKDNGKDKGNANGNAGANGNGQGNGNGQKETKTKPEKPAKPDKPEKPDKSESGSSKTSSR